MAFIDSVKEVITQKPVNLKKPHFYKVDSDAKNQLEHLKKLLKTVPNNVKSQLEQDIKMLTYGIIGEDNVAFELNNSHLPIIVIHDLHFEHDDLSAQIDYLIVTTKFTLIVECKNLIGNIDVNSNGDFIRTLEFNGKYKKEGIYSPITQNTRHIEMIKSIRLLSKNNFLSKALFHKAFDGFYKFVVVLANPKTIINMKYAKKDIKQQIIRCDQLIEHIKKLISESTNAVSTEKQMYEFADYFLSFHTPNTVDYTKKCNLGNSENRMDESKLIVISKVDVSEPIVTSKVDESKQIATNIEDTPLYKELRQYRYESSKAEGVKPYFIYNNAQMENIISTMPKNLNEIKKIPGFGDAKCLKYGNNILEILSKYN